MSTPLAQGFSDAWSAKPSPRFDGEDRGSHLEVVATRSQRKARPRTVYAMIAIGTLLAIIVTQLLLSIVVSQGAYQIESLQGEQTSLQRSYQSATEDLSRISSPQSLAANATALGMVSNPNLVYLRLSDGAVLGSPAGAPAGGVTATGKTGGLVPNSLLAGVPLVTEQSTGATVQPPVKTVKAENSASTSAPGTTQPDATVPFKGALPSPVTH